MTEIQTGGNKFIITTATFGVAKHSFVALASKQPENPVGIHYRMIVFIDRTVLASTRNSMNLKQINIQSTKPEHKRQTK
jgi:hypothetical protein